MKKHNNTIESLDTDSPLPFFTYAAHLQRLAAFRKHSPAFISLFLMLMIFTSRLSLSIRSISLATSLSLILFTVPVKDLINIFVQHPIARAAALLYGCLIIGTFYSPVSLTEQWHILKTYLPLLWIGFVMAFFRLPLAHLSKRFTSQRAKTYSCIFVYGVMLATLLGCLNAWHIIDVASLVHSHLVTDPPEYPFGTFSFSLSFAAYLSIQNAKHASSRKQYFRYLACFLFLSFFIFFVNHQRTAYILYIIALLFFGYQHWGIKGLIRVSVGLFFLALAAYSTSQTFSERTTQVVHDVKIYQKGDPSSSTGLRLFFLKASYHLWKEKPFFGYGTGSFKETYLTIDGYNINGHKNTPETALDQPHSDYAFILVQLGLFGFAFFLFLLFNQVFFSASLPIFEKQCAQAFILCFMVGALDTTQLFYATSITDYFFFTALFYASLKKSP